MRILFDLFPVLLFFIVFKLFGVYPATAAAMVATALQVAWEKWRNGKVDQMLWVSLAIISVFGGATLFFHNENFIKWKPTALYWFFAIAILFSRAFFDKNLMRLLLQAKITLPNNVWHYVNLAWGLFFAMLGALNLYIAFHYSMDIWVDFKLFGSMILMLIFILLQAIVLARYMKDEQGDKS